MIAIRAQAAGFLPPRRFPAFPLTLRHEDSNPLPQAGDHERKSRIALRLTTLFNNSV